MSGDVTKLLDAVQLSDPQAAEALLPLVYAELRQLAAQRLAQSPGEKTLQATALVHEAWLRLGSEGERRWASRAHYFAAAAEAMRRILVDRYRQKQSERRGGGAPHDELLEAKILWEGPSEEVLAVNESLDRLEELDPVAARLVKLRYFVGMDMTEAASALELPVRTTERLWSYARSWLRKEIEATGSLKIREVLSRPVAW